MDTATLLKLARLGFKHLRNAIAEQVYLATRYDMTRPVHFYAQINERCNVKCQHCAYWRLDTYRSEMTLQEWQQALSSIKDFVGGYSINFSGGEPLIQKDFFELILWCHENGILWGVTTNGSPLTRKNVSKLVKARPLNINISVDAPHAELHDELRGYPGLFAKLCDGIKYLREEQRKQGTSFPIIIKPTISSKNFRLMPEMVDWCTRIGATCVNFQPLYRWTPETYDSLWVEKPDHLELGEVTAKLIEMKRRSLPILNSEATLSCIVEHFQENPAPQKKRKSRLGLRDFSIRSNGDVEPSFTKHCVGNVRENTAKDIWYSEKARKIRSELTQSVDFSLHTNKSHKTILDKMRMALLLARG